MDFGLMKRCWFPGVHREFARTIKIGAINRYFRSISTRWNQRKCKYETMVDRGSHSLFIVHPSSLHGMCGKNCYFRFVGLRTRWKVYRGNQHLFIKFPSDRRKISSLSRYLFFCLRPDGYRTVIRPILGCTYNLIEKSSVGLLRSVRYLSDICQTNGLYV